ncbi:V-set domain containing T-cell activation inhibitor 1-like isoform X2 [Neopelma chrysocephalum]|uniref:V-set domain containing T-cell activation inhibitor 1-like isoform X2 n=1 Tax=Neopelma chrysocephalum TaxID=114329 RepID=UPI000FCD0C2B|nr:V-set domain containing T-cell activation inhibitor 1-like isoform X2 [Neopelma chrysocephalum]
MKWETALWMVACLLLVCLPRGQPETCHAFVGETVVLPCTITPPGELIFSKSMLYWQIDQKIVHFFQKGQDSPRFQDKRFHGRTSLFLDQMKHGNLSLKISNVQLQDNAEYTCIYKQDEDHQTKKSNIKLSVTGQSQIPSRSPPETPCLAVFSLSLHLLVTLGVWHL